MRDHQLLAAIQRNDLAPGKHCEANIGFNCLTSAKPTCVHRVGEVDEPVLGRCAIGQEGGCADGSSFLSFVFLEATGKDYGILRTDKVDRAATSAGLVNKLLGWAWWRWFSTHVGRRKLDRRGRCVISAAATRAEDHRGKKHRHLLEH
jgi:hypothetical protein